jgi:uncharacterized protein YprB with RNaseH-like and TPR domain
MQRGSKGDQMATACATAQIATHSKAKILLWDIEVADLKADRGHILCIAYKWLGRDTVYTISIENSPTWPKKLRDDSWVLKEFKEVFEEADNQITWYGKRFDEPFLRARLAFHNIGTIPHVHHTDLWEPCRKEFCIGRNSLDVAARFLRVENQKLHLPLDTFTEAAYGNVSALRNVVRRCAGDVQTLEDIYMKMRSLIRVGRFNKATAEGKEYACPICASKNVIKNGRRMTALTMYQKYHCKECGAWSSAPTKGWAARAKLR